MYTFRCALVHEFASMITGKSDSFQLRVMRVVSSAKVDRCHVQATRPRLDSNQTFHHLVDPELIHWIVEHPSQAEMKLLAPGLVYARIRGGWETFESIGISNISSANGEKDLHFLTACGEIYALHVVGGNMLYEVDNRDMTRSAFGAIVEDKLQKHESTVDSGRREGLVTAYVNGGFYNRLNPKFPNSTASKDKPEHATIGFTQTSDGVQMPFISPPQEYRDKYLSIHIGGKGIITGAPVIACNEQPMFTDTDMVEHRFKYDPNDITPGLLNHAEHPNPRTSLIIPTNPGRNANYRLMTAITTGKRGKEGTGFTMVEWAKVAARLSKVTVGEKSAIANTIALNLDGGASTVMGADMCGQKLLDIRQHQETHTPYLITVAPIRGYGVP